MGAVRRTGARRRDGRGDTLAFVVLWPAMFVAIVVLAAHTFIVVNAQAEASLAASAGLRAAWRAAIDSDLAQHGRPVGLIYWDESVNGDPQGRLEAVELMRERASDAVEQVAGAEHGWRWWTGAAVEVYSDWCGPPGRSLGGRGLARFGLPFRGETGWVRVAVTGEVVGPLSWLWPGRLDRVYAVAEGPALLRASPLARGAASPDWSPQTERWGAADLPRC